MNSCRHFLLVLLILTACSSEDPINTDIGLDYFPLRTGSQWIYQIEETVINQSVEEKSMYELRITLVDSIKSDLGVYSYIFNRATRTAEANPWQSIGTWSAQLSKNQLIQNESNINFVKMIFPLFSGSRWNGNQYNNLADNGNLFNGQGSEMYELTEFDKPMTLPTGLEFQQTSTIVQNNFVDPIVGTDQRKEVYARNVGLIFKEIIQLEYCTTPACLGQQKVDKGVIYVQTLTSYVAQ
jgi:hypothetical protein